MATSAIELPNVANPTTADMTGLPKFDVRAV
jgi:hypothetical protein